MSISRRRAAAGIAIVACYVLVASASFRAGLLPVRPLYQGTAPPVPYNWVKPPPGFEETNIPAKGGSKKAKVGAKGSEDLLGVTDDSQAHVIIPADAIPARAGQTQAELTIEPLDASMLGPPPEGLVYEGNAYRATLRYLPSGDDATIAKAATVVLRYPFFAEKIFRLDGGTWTALPAQQAGASLQLFGDTDRVGTFVAAGPSRPHPTSTPKSGGRSDVLAALGGIVAAGIGIAIARWTTIRRKRTATRARRARRAQQARRGRR